VHDHLDVICCGPDAGRVADVDDPRSKLLRASGQAVGIGASTHCSDDLAVGREFGDDRGPGAAGRAEHEDPRHARASRRRVRAAKAVRLIAATAESPVRLHSRTGNGRASPAVSGPMLVGVDITAPYPTIALDIIVVR